jgi:hypothetical protein
VVGPQLQLKSILCLQLRRCHNTCMPPPPIVQAAFWLQVPPLAGNLKACLLWGLQC